MNPYWNVISIKHQNKLRFLSKKSGITIDHVLCNIINFLKNEWDTASRAYYLKEFKESKDIENMIDIITK